MCGGMRSHELYGKGSKALTRDPRKHLLQSQKELEDKDNKPLLLQEELSDKGQQCTPII